MPFSSSVIRNVLGKFSKRIRMKHRESINLMFSSGTVRERMLALGVMSSGTML